MSYFWNYNFYFIIIFIIVYNYEVYLHGTKNFYENANFVSFRNYVTSNGNLFFIKHAILFISVKLKDNIFRLLSKYLYEVQAKKRKREWQYWPNPWWVDEFTTDKGRTRTPELKQTKTVLSNTTKLSIIPRRDKNRIFYHVPHHYHCALHFPSTGEFIFSLVEFFANPHVIYSV